MSIDNSTKMSICMYIRTNYCFYPCSVNVNSTSIYPSFPQEIKIPGVVLILLINVKMQTIVGILIFMSKIHFMLI